RAATLPNVPGAICQNIGGLGRRDTPEFYRGNSSGRAMCGAGRLRASMRSSVWRAPVALWLLMLPGSVLAQAPAVTLPEVNGIGPTPLSTPRPAPRPSGGGTSQRATTGTPATVPVPTPTVAVPVSDPGVIDRNKVPSNTVTLTAQDFDHAVA